MKEPNMAHPLDYNGQTVVVTGAATGMGAETVALLDTLGAYVHAVDIVDVADPVASTHRR
ncbi:MAG: hypothetical protein VYD63_02490 [Actinomycetota bacterium]|nr:hypothetical protein [Actinomycetota bacterium]